MQPIQPGQRWRKVKDGAWVCRVMAVSEGFVLARYPYCSPFVVPVFELRKAFRLVE